MPSLRDLMEETLEERKDAGSALKGKGLAGLVGYNNRLRQGGQWKGAEMKLTSKPPAKKVGLRSPNPYHDALGRFTNVGKGGAQKPTSASWGKGAARAMLSGKGSKIKVGVGGGAGGDVGRDSGSGKTYRSNKTGGFQAQGKANGPSPDRKLARTGKTKADSGEEGLAHVPMAVRKKHLRNLLKRGKKKQAQSGGMKFKADSQRRSAGAAAVDFGYVPGAQQSFLARLGESYEEPEVEEMFEGYTLDDTCDILGAQLEALIESGDDSPEVLEAIERVSLALESLMD